MKKIIIYLATMLLAAMTFTGCYDLETYPGDKVNEGTFYKTGDHAHQGLMGIYGMLRLNEAYGYQFCFDHLGDIAYGYNYYMMFLATYTDRDGTIQAHWQTFYDGIHRVNTFIRSVKGMRGIITDEQINENDKMIFCDSLLSQFLLKFNQLRISLFPMELTKSP